VNWAEPEWDVCGHCGFKHRPCYNEGACAKWTEDAINAGRITEEQAAARVHEEVWTSDNGLCSDFRNGGCFAHFDTHSIPRFWKVNAARQRLAAQAPKMARLLMSLPIPCCKSHTVYDEGHSDDCTVATVLRDAGVLP